MSKRIAIIGTSGAIGAAFLRLLSSSEPDTQIYSFSRSPLEISNKNVHHCLIDYSNEQSIQEAAHVASQDGPLDLVIVATGMLQEGECKPEKNLKELSAEKFHRLIEVNAVLPALIGKHFIPCLNKDSRSIFAALSARVGSISDNQLGGWYSYRASKAALNMILKTLAIETARKNKQAIIVALHPGTVKSRLSEPFSQHLPESALFTPEYSAGKLLEVLNHLSPEKSGSFFAWDGEEIQP